MCTAPKHPKEQLQHICEPINVTALHFSCHSEFGILAPHQCVILSLAHKCLRSWSKNLKDFGWGTRKKINRHSLASERLNGCRRMAYVSDQKVVDPSLKQAQMLGQTGTNSANAWCLAHAIFDARSLEESILCRNLCPLSTPHLWLWNTFLFSKRRSAPKGGQLHDQFRPC
jgi:hypothetical protein